MKYLLTCACASYSGVADGLCRVEFTSRSGALYVYFTPLQIAVSISCVISGHSMTTLYHKIKFIIGVKRVTIGASDQRLETSMVVLVEMYKYN